MVNVNKLRGVMAEQGLSQAEVANKLGITPNTLYRKMKRGVFTSADISAMIKVLEISDPMSIFFAETVS